MVETPEYERDDVEYNDMLLMVVGDEPITGQVVVRNAAGVIVESVDYFHGIKHGSSREFYDNGVRKSVIEFQAGVPQGTGMAWWQSGALKAEVVYDGGDVVSAREWDPAGNERAVTKRDPIQG